MRTSTVIVILLTAAASAAFAIEVTPLEPVKSLRPETVVEWTERKDEEPAQAPQPDCEELKKKVRAHTALTPADQVMREICENAASNAFILQNTSAHGRAARAAASTGGGAPLSFESTLINSFADLLTRRFQAETVSIISEDLGDKLCNSTMPDSTKLSGYFSESCDLLLHPAAGEGSVANLTRLGPIFQNALYDDMQTFLPKLVNNAPIDDDVKLTATILVQTFDGLRRGETPVGMIAGVSRVVECKENDDKRCAIQLISMMTGSLLTKGLWKDVDLDNPDDVEEVVSEALQSLDQGLESHPALKEWRERAGLAPKRTKVYLRALLPPIHRLAVAVQRESSISPSDDAALRANAVQIISDAFSVWRAGLEILSTEPNCVCSWTTRAIQTTTALNTTFTALSNKDIPGFVQSFFPLAATLNLPRGILPEPLQQKYLPLLVALVSAKDGDELAAAFDLVEPVSGDKNRQTPGMIKISVDGAVGGTMAWQARQGQAAAFAPIGIDFTYRAQRGFTAPTRGWKAALSGVRHNAFGVFVSVFDLGVATSARISGSDEQQVESKVADVFSPGVLLRWNAYRSIVIGGGYSLGPRLRSDPADTGTRPSRQWRKHLFIGVDLPLFGLR